MQGISTLSPASLHMPLYRAMADTKTPRDKHFFKLASRRSLTLSGLPLEEAYYALMDDQSASGRPCGFKLILEDRANYPRGHTAMVNYTATIRLPILRTSRPTAIYAMETPALPNLLVYLVPLDARRNILGAIVPLLRLSSLITTDDHLEILSTLHVLLESFHVIFALGHDDINRRLYHFERPAQLVSENILFNEALTLFKRYK